jgi:carbon monoxide dehydrogenase subunit G
MQLTSQQLLPASQAQAWAALNDTEVLKACIPGCESIVPNGPDQFELLVTAAIGPVKAKFKGKLRLADIQPPESYTIHFDGQGGAAGFGKGSAKVRLEPTSATSSTLHYSADAQVGGKIAQIGSRLVDMAATKMAGDFFAAFSAKLFEMYGAINAAPPPPPKPQGLVARFVAWVKGLFS